MELSRLLRPRWVLPMRNGAVDAVGLSAPLIEELGTEAEFERRLREAKVAADVVDVRPGELQSKTWTFPQGPGPEKKSLFP